MKEITTTYKIWDIRSSFTFNSGLSELKHIIEIIITYCIDLYKRKNIFMKKYCRA